MGAEFTIEGTAFDTLGYDATHGQVLDLALEDSTGLDAPRVVYSVVATSDGAPALTFSPSSGIPTTPTGTVTVTMPGSGAHSYNIQCQVNEGRDSTGRTNREYTKQRIVAIKSTNLELRKLVPGETTQYSSTGWTEEQNTAVDAIDAGAGGGGGTTEDVNATADTLLLRGSAGEGRVTRIETPIVRTATNGDVEFQHGSTRVARLRSTSAVASPLDFSFRSNGRMRVYSQALAAAEDVVLRTDVTNSASVEREAETGSATQTYSRVLCPYVLLRMRLVRAVLFPYDDLLSNASNYAEVRLVRVFAFTPTTLASIVTSGDNWTAENSIDFTISEDEIPQFGYLRFETAKSGSGVLLPRFAAFFEWAADPTWDGT